MRSCSTTIRLLNQIFADTKPFMRLLTVFTLMGISYLSITFLGLLLATLLFSLSWPQLQDIIAGGMLESDMGLFYYLQGLQTLGLFIIPALLAHLLLFKEGERFFTGKHSDLLLTGFLALITLILSAPFLQWIIQWNAEIQLPDSLKKIETALQLMEEERLQVFERLLGERSGRIFIINILIISVLPALGEEFFFRGILQRLLGDWFRNSHLGIIIAAMCFSAIHMQFYGFFPRLLLGIYFGYLYFWSKNIWLPVLAHFLNNSIAISLSFFADDFNVRFTDFLAELNNNSLMALIVSIILTIVLLFLTQQSLQVSRKFR